MHRTLFLAIIAVSSGASAVTIDFEDLTVGTTLSNQYSGIGVTFAPGTGGITGIPNFVSPNDMPFATNTDMTIVDISGDVGGNVGPPTSGHLLHARSGWLDENGDAVFVITFSTNITSISMSFSDVLIGNSGGIHAVVGSAVTSSAFAPTGNSTVSLINLTNVNRIAVTPGNFDDWVGIDNVTFTPVPEPGTMLAVGAGIAALVARRRRGR